MNIRRHKHRPTVPREANSAGAENRRLTAAEVDALTARADQLLDELHSVTREMSERLATLTAGADSSDADGGQ